MQYTARCMQMGKYLNILTHRADGHLKQAWTLNKER